MIQDGDFADVEKGQDRSFGIEIVPAPAWTAPINSDSTIGSSRLDGHSREFVGELVFVEDRSWVMDVGILGCGFMRDLPLVYADREMPDIRVGDRFAGQGSFLVLADAIDLDFEAAPPQHYSWSIDRIELETTPWVEVESRSFRRDADNVSYREVDRTDAWHDDQGHPDYLLHCSLLFVPHA